MQQNSYQRAGGFLLANVNALPAKRTYRLAHQVHRPQRVGETAVHGAGIDQIGETQLTNTYQSLHQRMLQHIIQQIVRNTQKTENRVVDNFMFIRHGWCFANLPQRYYFFPIYANYKYIFFRFFSFFRILIPKKGSKESSMPLSLL